MTIRAVGIAALLVSAVPLLLAHEQAATSGIDLASFDRSVRPQDDLYRYVNGAWLDRTTIPPEQVSFSASTELVMRVEADLREIIEGLTKKPQRKGSPEQQIADFYTSLLDRETIARLGFGPIEPELRKIEAIDSASAFAAEVGHLTSIGAAGAFGTSLAVDPTDPRYPMVEVAQGGLLMPDPEYYLGDAPTYVAVRQKYETYLTTIFRLTNRPDPAREAQAVIGLETALARAHLPLDEARVVAQVPARFTLADLQSRMPGFDWRAWARPQGIDLLPGVLVAQPSFFTAFAALVETEPIEAWRAWLAARYITTSASYLSDEVGDARFAFFGTELIGQELPREFWRRGVALVNAYLGDALGRLYVERRFPARSKSRVERMAANVIAAYRHALENLTWMSARTKAEANRKLSRLSVKIGYPTRWRSYRGLEIDPGDLLGNIERGRKFEGDFRMRWLGRPVSPGAWLMSPQTVNAYYSAGMNEVVFPAAILQPPFFITDADDAINYGAIGAVIGHEIGHAFLDRGRVFDANGRVADWWSDRDDMEYQARAARLVEQFDAYEVVDGVHVNGRLTLGENLGDLAGLAVALRAYRASLGGKPPPVIDGFTGEQRFFIGWAQIWRTIDRDAFLRQFALSNPHAPGPFRANGAVVHLGAFYDAFDVKPGDRLYRDPRDRVAIW